MVQLECADKDQDPAVQRDSAVPQVILHHLFTHNPFSFSFVSLCILLKISQDIPSYQVCETHLIIMEGTEGLWVVNDIGEIL